jgi:autotransporter adhesin
VKYDLVDDGKGGKTINYNNITLGGDAYDPVTKQGGTKIRNVARGDVTPDSSDAVNGSQLYETNQIINNFAGDQSEEYTALNGRGIRYVRTNDTGLEVKDAYATGQGSTAVGYEAKAQAENSLALGRNAVAGDKNSVALGADSVTAAAVSTESAVINGITYNFAGILAGGTVSVGAPGFERTITNVAAGRLSATSTDAVNGSQLFATNLAIEDLSNKFKNGGGGGMEFYSVTVDSSATRNAEGNFDNRGADGTTNSVAAGPSALVKSDNSVALGYNAVVNAGAGSSVALGANAVAEKAVAVASAKVGNTTFSGFAGTAPVGVVSVGAVGAERQITNVAAGQVTETSTDAVNGSQLFSVAKQVDGAVKYDINPDGSTNRNSITLEGDTYNAQTHEGGTRITNVADGVNPSDAVNVNQLNQLGNQITEVSNRLDTVNKDANAGTAGAIAMANMPQATLPGKNFFSAGLGGFKGQGALAMGVSRLSDDQRWGLKAAGSVTTRGNLGVSASVGFHW